MSQPEPVYPYSNDIPLSPKVAYFVSSSDDNFSDYSAPRIYGKN